MADCSVLRKLRVQAVTFAVFVVMGALAGLAALLNAVRFPQVDPNAGTGRELQVIAALPLGLTAEAAYSFLSAENLRPGRSEGHSLSYRPPHRLFVRVAHRSDRTEAYAETNFTASMPRNQFDTAFLPAQLLVNAGAGARIGGPVWFDVEVKNLLDDRRLQDLFQYPLPGLSLAAMVRARL